MTNLTVSVSLSRSISNQRICFKTNFPRQTTYAWFTFSVTKMKYRAEAETHLLVLAMTALQCTKPSYYHSFIVLYITLIRVLFAFVAVWALPFS